MYYDIRVLVEYPDGKGRAKANSEDKDDDMEIPFDDLTPFLFRLIIYISKASFMQ